MGSRVIERRKISASLTPTRLHLKNIVQIAAGAYHSYAVDKNGVVFAWGLNAHRQTGVADDDIQHEGVIMMATEVSALHPSLHNGSKVISIACGMFHSLFLFGNGKVYACGSCIEGRLGLADSHPVIMELNKLKAEAKELRRLWTAEETERLVKTGIARFDAEIEAGVQAVREILMPDELVKIPTHVSFPSGDEDSDPSQNLAGGEQPRIVHIAGNSYHSFAVSSRGDVYAFGYSGTSTLGLGNEELVKTPTKLKFPNIWKKGDVMKYKLDKGDKDNGWQEHKVCSSIAARFKNSRHSAKVRPPVKDRSKSYKRFNWWTAFGSCCWSGTVDTRADTRINGYPLSFYSRIVPLILGGALVA